MATTVEEILLRIRTDTGDSQEELAALFATLEQLDGSDTEADVDVRTAEALAELALLEKELSKIDGEKVTARADIDTSSLTSKLAKASRDLASFNNQKVADKQMSFDLEGLAQVPKQLEFDIKFDASQARSELAALESQLQGITDENVEVHLKANEVISDAAALQAALDSELHGVDIDVDLKDTGTVIAEAKALNEAVDAALGSADVDVGVGGAGAAFKEMASGASELAKSAGDAKGPLDSVGISVGQLSFRLGSGATAVIGLAGVIIGALIAALGMLVASAGAAVAALGALAVAAAATLGPALLLGGAIVQRFTKILEAKKAQDAAATAATKDAAGAAKQAAAADEQRRNAAIAVRDARQAVERAERAVGEASKKAAKDIEDAVKAEAKAHRDVTEAVRDYKRAQDETRSARADARKDIVDATKAVAAAEESLKRTIADASKDDVRARREVINAHRVLEDAITDGNKAIADSFTEVRDSILEVKYAQLGLEDAKDKVSDLEKEIEKLSNAKIDPDYLKGLTDVELTGFDAGSFFTGESDAEAKAEKLSDLMRELARARLDVEKATNNVADAQVREANATSQNNKYIQEGLNAYQPYKDALQGVRDANLALTDSQNQSAQVVKDSLADLDVAKAKLADLQAQGINGSSGVISALEREHDARVRLRNARDEEAEAEKKLSALRAAGIAGASGVINARESLRDAEENLTEALHRQKYVAQQAAAAAGAPSAAALKAKEAVAQLTAAEKELLGVLRQLFSAFRVMTSGGTDAFFNSLSDAIRAILPAMRELRPAFTELGKAAGKFILALAKELARPENVQFFKDMASAAADLIRIIGTDAFISFFRILRNIATATMPFLIAGAQAFADLLRQWAKDTGNTEKLSSVIGELVESLRVWVKLSGALGKLFWSFIRAVGPIGNELVEWLAEGAEALAKWMNSKEGMRITKEFFRDSLPLVKELTKFVGQFLVLFLQVFGRAAPMLAPTFEVLNNILGAVIKLTQAWFDLTKPIRDFIVLIQNFAADVVDGFVNGLAGMAKRVLEAFKDVVEAVLKFFGISSPSTLFTDIGKNVAQGFIDGFKSLSGTIIGTVKDVIRDVFNAAKDLPGKVVSAIGSGAGNIFQAAKDRFDSVVDAIQSVMSSLFANADNIPGKVVSAIKSGVGNIFEAAKDRFDAVVNAVKSVIESLVSNADNIPGKVISAIKNAAGNIYDAAKERFDGISSAMGTAKDAVVGIAEGIVSAIRKVFSAGGGLAKAFINSIVDLLNDLIPNKIKIPGPAPDINLPDNPIPRLASGGLAKKSLLAIVGDNPRFDEAVLPLSPQVFSQLAEGIVDKIRNLQIGIPSFPMPAVAGSPAPLPGAQSNGGVNIDKVILPPVAADQNGFDGRQGAALLMQELNSRGAA